MPDWITTNMRKSRCTTRSTLARNACVNSAGSPSATKATRNFSAVVFTPGDVFLFGPETRGLPAEVLACFSPDHRLRVPMRAGNRSLNLSNAVSVVVYEAWRQNGFAGGS